MGTARSTLQAAKASLREELRAEKDVRGLAQRALKRVELERENAEQQASSAEGRLAKSEKVVATLSKLGHAEYHQQLKCQRKVPLGGEGHTQQQKQQAHTDAQVRCFEPLHEQAL